MWKNLAVAVLLSASSFTFAAESVDINTADAVALAQGLHGVGPAKAIVAYREKNGPFKSVDDLVAVQGIGEQTVKVNREHMTVGAPTPSE
jgi:competence protein ComEA